MKMKTSRAAILRHLLLALATGLLAGAIPVEPAPERFCEIGAFTPSPDGFRRICDGKLANCMFYMNWNDAPGEFGPGGRRLQAARASGGALWIKWSPQLDTYFPGEANHGRLYDHILEGRFDGYLRACGAELAKLEAPFRLDFAHEMNGGWKPYGGPVNQGLSGDGPARFVAVWRRVHDLIVGAGLKNCLWVWAPASLRSPLDPGDRNDLSRYYPGDAYVDEVGFSVYNKRARIGQSFAELFQASYDACAVIAPRKPIVISEMGCSSEDPDKAAWIRATFTAMRVQFPRVRAFNWFNRDSRNKKDTGSDHRIDADPEVTAAMREAMADPYFIGEARSLAVLPGTVQRLP